MRIVIDVDERKDAKAIKEITNIVKKNNLSFLDFDEIYKRIAIATMLACGKR